MNNSRYANKRIKLRKGEYQRSNNTFAYWWFDKNGKRQFVYAKSLPELREKEEQITKDTLDGIDYSKLHTDVLCASAISALISSIVHSRSPLANRSALPRSNISQNCRPSNLRDSDAPDAGYSPMMNGMVRVRTTCLRKTVRALVMVRPSSRKTSSQSRLRSSSIRNVVVMHVSLMSSECLWRVLYQIFPFETKAGMFDLRPPDGGLNCDA